MTRGTKPDIRIGLKVWSTNDNFVLPGKELIEEGYCQFLEIYCVPGTGRDAARIWKGFNVPIIIHAPHHAHGMNLSLRENEPNNKCLIEETKRLADELLARGIVFHGGSRGNLDELIRQLRAIDDNRTIIENKPVIGINDEICVAVSPEDISRIISELGVKFCLDINHAMHFSAYHGTDPYHSILRFLQLNPSLFHLSDGLLSEAKDLHLNIGDGDYDLERLVGLLRRDAWVTLETPKKNDNNLSHLRSEIEKIVMFRARSAPLSV